MSRIILFDYKGTTNSHENAKFIGLCREKGDCVFLRTASPLREVRDDEIVSVSLLHGFIMKGSSMDNFHVCMNYANRNGFDIIKEIIFVDDEPWTVESFVYLFKQDSSVPVKCITPNQMQSELIDQ